MRIAVPLENGNVFQHFGHSEQFKIYDAEYGKVVALNIIRAENGGHGALAALLGDHGVDVLICGGIGEGARNALEEQGIAVFPGITGSADEAVEAYLNGDLEEGGANCDHHSSESSCEGHDCASGGCSGCSGCHSQPAIEGKNVGKVCKAHYIGTFNDGTQFDSSYDRGEPLEFVCGTGMMIRGFDEAVANMEVGESIQIHLMPSQAYGETDPNAVFTVELSMLPGIEEVPVGERIYLTNAYGNRFGATIVKRDEKTVTFDANHEMAGKELNFQIELVEVKG
ncbi:MAG: FKBP-type peptidyl-prolyl cis-trans isomerase [Lachnospiraceae bacterium]|nr:FKBP-type peptidyl-prolyl cis-trans isomerase [Lachnospiraceae bacterium]